MRNSTGLRARMLSWQRDIFAQVPGALARRTESVLCCASINYRNVLKWVCSGANLQRHLLLMIAYYQTSPLCYTWSVAPPYMSANVSPPPPPSSFSSSSAVYTRHKDIGISGTEAENIRETSMFHSPVRLPVIVIKFYLLLQYLSLCPCIFLSFRSTVLQKYTKFLYIICPFSSTSVCLFLIFYYLVCLFFPMCLFVLLLPFYYFHISVECFCFYWPAVINGRSYTMRKLDNQVNLFVQRQSGILLRFPLLFFSEDRFMEGRTL